MFACDLLHGLFGVVVPVDIGFYCTENVDVMFADVSTSVVPFGPSVVGSNATCILKSEAKSCWLV